MELKPFTGELDKPADADSLKPFSGQLDAPDQAAPAAPLARPTAEGEDHGFVGGLVRGFKANVPQIESLTGAAIGAAGSAIGWDAVRDYGLDLYRRKSAEAQPLEGPSFADVRGDLTKAPEYVGNVLGNFGGQALLSGAAGLAGGLIGGGATAETGPGAVVGAGLGAIGGVVARGAVVKAIEKKAAELVAEQVGKGVAKDVAESAGKKFVADQVASEATKKTLRQAGGAAVGAYIPNAAQEIGTSFGARADDLKAQGRPDSDLTAGDAWRAIGAGAVSGAVDTAAEALQVGRLFKGASSNPSLVKRVLAGMAKGTLTEGGTEAAQAVLERLGASQSLTDADALNDYLENFAAGAVGGAFIGAGSGMHRRDEEGNRIGHSEINGGGNGAAPTTREGWLGRIDGAQQAVLDAQHDDARDAAIRNLHALRAQAGAAGFQFPAQITSHPVAVAPDGTATTAAQQLDVAQQEASRQASLAGTGLTPDVSTAQLRHPGFPAQAAPAGPSAEQAAADGLRTQADALATSGPLGQATAITLHEQADLLDAAPPGTLEAAAHAEQSAREQQAAAEAPPTPPPAPWIDAASGEVRAPTDGELKQYLHDAINAQSDRGINRKAIEQNLWNLGVTRERTGEVWKQVVAERKAGHTAPATENADATQDRTGPAAADVGQESLFADGQDDRATATDQGRAQPGVQTEPAAAALDRGPAADPVADAAERGSAATDVADAAAAAPAQGLTYDSSEDQQDADIGAPSGGPFTIEDAAHRAARRVEGGRVFPVDGGFVVRTPKVEAGTELAKPTGTEATPARAALNVRMGDKEFPVDSIEDASAKFLQLRDAAKGDLGGMPAVHLIDQQGRPVGYIGHNGEVYEGPLGTGDDRAKPVYDPKTPNRYGSQPIDGTAQAAQEQPPTSASRSRPTGFPVGGYYALDANGEPIRPKEGELPKRFNTPEAAEAFANKYALLPTEVHTAAHEAATSPQNDLTPPTPAQLDAGNFKVGRIRVNGLDISIEHPAGVKRKPEHSRALAHAYGYIRRTEGADGEKVDVFLGDHAADTTKPVFVIDQKKRDGSFDEHKAMLGFDNEAAARKAYLANYPRGWDKKGLGGIRQMSQDEFKAWVQNPEQTKQPAAAPAANPDPVAAAIAKIADGTHPERALEGLDADTVRAVAAAMGRKFSPKASATAIAERLGEEARGDWMARAKKAVSTVAPRVTPERGTTSAIATVRTIYGDTVRVLQSDLDGDRNLLRMVDAKGNPKRGKSTMLARGNIATDEQIAANHNDLRLITRRGAKSAKEEAFLKPEGVVREIKRLGQNPDDFEIRKHGNGYVGVRKKAGAEDEGSWTAESTPGEPNHFVVRDQNGDRVGSILASSPEKAISDLKREKARSEPASEPSATTAVTEAMKKNPMPDAQREAAWRKLRNVPTVETEREPATPGPETVRAAKAAEVTSAEGKIEDFGEKISGARKDAAREYAQRLSDAKEVDVATNPLSKSWPEPDYQALLDAGADPWAVSFAHTARDEIPTKPSKSWKLKGWVAQVKMLRDAVQLAIESEATRAKLRARWDSAEFASLRKALEGRRELYQTFGHAVSLKGISFAEHHYTLYQGQSNVTKWSIDRAAKATAFSNWPHELAIGDTKQEALDKFKAVHAKMVADAEKGGGAKPKTPTKFIIYSRRSQKGKWIIGKKIGTEHFDLATFDSVNEARAYLQDHQPELVAKLAAARNIPSERKADNAPRVGIDHRNGADVTPEQFGESFGFRGVQFGNYVEGPRRQADLNRAYDALMDMAGILGLPARALSLNGELGLAFGARGTGGQNPAAAHYEPVQVVINLTKGNGPGSLAHEWFHALDNYFSRMGGKRTGYVTDPKRNPGTEGLRPEMVHAFKDLMAAIHATRLQERSRELDKRKGKPYWSTDLEMAARSFESYMLAKLADNQTANDYLVNVVGQQAWEEATGPNSYPYHIAEDVPAIRAAFDHFFQTVQTREGDNGNVVLFRRTSDGNRSPVDVDATVEEIAGQWVNAPAVRVVATAKDLPPHIVDAYRRYGSDGGDVRGVYDPKSKTIFVVRDNVRSRGDVESTLFHEAVGHHGLRLIFGDQILQQVRRLTNALGGWGGIMAYAKKNGIDLSAYNALRRDGRLTEEQQADVLMDELFAHMAERIDTLPKGLAAKIRKFLGAIRSWLRRNGFTALAGNLSDGELAYLLHRANRAVLGEETALAPNLREEARFNKTQAPGAFYSAALSAIEAGKGAPKRADAAAWKGWLDGAVRRGDMKRTERDWLGLDDWLAKQDGPVTREQLADFVRANQVQVQDVVLGDSKPFEEPMIDVGDVSVAETEHQWIATVPQKGVIGRREVAIGKGTVGSEAEAKEYAVRYFNSQAKERNRERAKRQDDQTKFGEYQLPGGENYRELLLTLPVSGGDPLAGKSREELGRLYEAEIGYNPIEDDPSITTEQLREDVRSLGPAATGAGTSVSAEISGGTFQSSHFDQPNILAHVRFNERTDADGKKVLFLEEVQSDWHQQGRKRGYAKDIDTSGWSYKQPFNDTYEVFDAGGHLINRVTATSFSTAREKTIRLMQEAGGTTPDAPFKATDEWAMLAFKRMVRWAAEHGFDRIAWTTGEQQAERYDLSKQVDSIEYSPAGDDKYDLRVKKDDRDVLSEDGITLGRAEELVGKDVAKRMADSVGEPVTYKSRFSDKQREWKSLTGLDLKVGGEGMRGFYDKILPAAVNKWAKRFGAKVGATGIAMQDAKQAAIKWDGAHRVEPATTVHSIDITPAMREAALAGQPLFRIDTDGRGRRSISMGGETFVERGDHFYMVNGTGEPKDFRTLGAATEAAKRTGGEVLQDDAIEGERPSWSVVVPGAAQRAASAETPRFSLAPSQGASREVEFTRGQEALQSRLAQWSSALRLGQGGPRPVGEGAESIGPVDRTATGAAKQGDESREAIREQSARLIQRAKDEGFFWGDDSPVIGALSTLPEGSVNGGAEHQVFMVGEGENRFVIRATDNGFFGPRSDISPAQYLARLEDYNRTFPSMQMRLIGVSESKDVPGNAVIWTAQPFVRGEKFSSQNALEQAFAAKGWVRDGYPGSPRFVDKATGTVIEDAHTDNVFHDADGNLYPFDVVVEKMPSDDVRFSFASKARDDLNEALATAGNNLGDVKLPAGYVLGDLFQRHDDTTLHWWHKTVGTQFNLAQRSPEFRRVFDSVQNMVSDISHFANGAMDLAPGLLPKFDSWRDVTKKKPLAAADARAVSKAVFDGTLKWTRDEDGKVVPAKDAADGGIVWTDAELRQRFGMNERQIDLYRQTRASIDRSLDDTAVSQMIRFAGDDAMMARDEMLAAGSARRAAMVLRDRLMEDAGQDPGGRGPSLLESARKVMDVADQVDRLKDRGYAPLSRFGRFTVYRDGAEPLFLMFESKREANRALRNLKASDPKGQFRIGTMSEDQFKQFKGLTPETLELFGEMLGLDRTGNDADDLVFQSFLKAAKSNRSALKRLIHREGIAGYSEDVARVLASFLYSNARLTATNLHAPETAQAIKAIPKEKGELKDAALQLNEYVTNPDDAGAWLQGFNFAQYLGGSIASALVNMTQPITMSFPWLSQYGGAWAAARALKDGAALAVKQGSTGDHLLDAALKRADADGHTQPQEVHQLQAYAAGRGVLRSGDGTQAGDAAAKAYNAKARAMLAWGLPFALAEQFNRRTTFIAAWKTAKEQGMQDPYGFAVQAVQATQGIYNKANKPAWSRNAIGGMAFTFKQYSINYVEMLHRMWTQGGPEGKKGVLLAAATMFLIAGAGGLPGADDLDDLIDGLMQRLGYNFSSKQAREQFFAGILGDGAASFMEHGLSAVPGMPVDVSGRLGMGNLLPATGLLVRKDDHTRDVMELAGPTGDFATRSLQAADQLSQGNLGASMLSIVPRAVANAWKGVDMARTGQYSDTRGRKVLSTDLGEAAAKAIGFQPASVAKVQQAGGIAQGLVANYRLASSEIADRWAKGLYEHDPDEVLGARDELEAWNRKNPDMPIRITSSQLRSRLRNLAMDKPTRLAKTAPSAVREAVREQVTVP